jgi:enoyl-CoA hydratase/carnithine racemase
VARVVPHGELLDTATEVLVACCRTAPGARTDIKRELDAYYGLYDRIGMAQSLGAEEAVEGWRAFKERRPPSWIHPDLRPEGRL